MPFKLLINTQTSQSILMVIGYLHIDLGFGVGWVEGDDYRYKKTLRDHYLSIFLFCFCLVLLSMLLASLFFSFVQTIQSFLWPQLILQLILHHCLPFLSVPPSLPPSLPPPPPVIANLYCNRFPLTPGSGFFSAFKLRKQPEISRYSMPATYDNGSKKVVQIPGATQVVKHQIRRNRCDGIYKCIHKRARAQECTAPHE